MADSPPTKPVSSQVVPYRKPAPPDDDVSFALSIVGPASSETAKFLQDLAFTVRYQDFPDLKVQEFLKLRALACSDEFESVPDDVRQQAIRTARPLYEWRAYPEYAVMKQRLREAFLSADEPEESPQAWVKRMEAANRRNIERALRSGINDNNREAAKLAAEAWDRVHPKASRNQTDIPVVHASDELQQMLGAALAAYEKARSLPGNTEEKTDGEQSGPEDPV